MIDRFTLSPFEFFVLHTRTRFPFRYGIASMTEVPHLFVRTTVTVAGNPPLRVSAPKACRRNGSRRIRPRRSSRTCPRCSRSSATRRSSRSRSPGSRLSFFDFWRELYRQQSDWADARHIASLLANLGVSLVERAVLDGLCRVAGEPLHRMVATNRLGLRLGDIYAEFGDAEPRGPAARRAAGVLLRAAYGRAGRRAVAGRHLQRTNAWTTVCRRIWRAPFAPTACGISKSNSSPTRSATSPRLRELSRLLERETGGDMFVTLDGNENFKDFEAFREFWQKAAREPALRDLWRASSWSSNRCIATSALSDDPGAALRAWPDRPRLDHRRVRRRGRRFAAGARARLRRHEPQELQRHRERHRERLPAGEAAAGRRTASS